MLANRSRASREIWSREPTASAQKKRKSRPMGPPPPLQKSARGGNNHLHRSSEVSWQPASGQVSLSSAPKQTRQPLKAVYVPKYKRRKIEAKNPLYEDYKGIIEIEST